MYIVRQFIRVVAVTLPDRAAKREGLPRLDVHSFRWMQRLSRQTGWRDEGLYSLAATGINIPTHTHRHTHSLHHIKHITITCHYSCDSPSQGRRSSILRGHALMNAHRRPEQLQSWGVAILNPSPLPLLRPEINCSHKKKTTSERLE